MSLLCTDCVPGTVLVFSSGNSCNDSEMMLLLPPGYGQDAGDPVLVTELISGKLTRFDLNPGRLVPEPTL